MLILMQDILVTSASSSHLSENHFRNVVQRFLPQLGSYYYLILFDYGGLRKGGSLF